MLLPLLLASISIAQTAPEPAYTLHVPKNYTADRAWPLLLGFDPRARGANVTDRFAEAAETYGWIVAGSNQSRNGSWEVSSAALETMSKEVLARYNIDPKRIYTTGMSGGARVAMQVAMGTGRIAGVIAASAGYPDVKPRKTVPFAIFGTAGTEDFNWLEMRELDRELTTPHRLRVFEGGHVWMSADLATEAVEWMELQAMKSGIRVKDAALWERLLSKRKAALEALSGKAAWDAARSIAMDFGDADAAGRAKVLERDKAVKDGIRDERREAELEWDRRGAIGKAEGGLSDPVRRRQSLDEVREIVGRLARDAKAEADSGPRRVARRITRSIAAGGGEAARDPEYRKLLEELGLTRRPI